MIEEAHIEVMKQEKKSCYAFLILETTAIATVQGMRQTQSTNNAVSKTSSEAPKRGCQKVSTAERREKNNHSGERKSSFPRNTK